MFDSPARSSVIPEAPNTTETSSLQIFRKNLTKKLEKYKSCDDPLMQTMSKDLLIAGQLLTDIFREMQIADTIRNSTNNIGTEKKTSIEKVAIDDIKQDNPKLICLKGGAQAKNSHEPISISPTNVEIDEWDIIDSILEEQRLRQAVELQSKGQMEEIPSDREIAMLMNPLRRELRIITNKH